ncbi:hypothetical protein [Streptomyces lincolnensis]|nr:hypothetical protein [Streptomyces lincolnensis]
MGGSIGVAVVSTVAATTSAVVALGLVPRGTPQMTGGPHVH